jgi:hypothetical protein
MYNFSLAAVMALCEAQRVACRIKAIYARAGNSRMAETV